MSTTLTPVLKQRFVDNNGAPLLNGTLASYQAGTSTPLATYTDSTGGTPNTNPIVLDVRGEANVWVPANTAYKFVLSDSLGNIIWSVDQVVNSLLTSLYGGVDSGSVNAYAINFTANFSSLSDGIVIYWIPSHTNTGPSTLNVNGLGVINVTYQTGGSLTAGSIIANQVTGVLYKGGNWLILNAPNVINTLSDGTAAAPSLSWASNPTTGLYNLGSFGVGFTVNGVAAGSISSGSWTPVWTGFGTPPVGDIKYSIFGKMVAIYSISGLTATSNATSMAITNVPGGLMPASANSGVICMLEDNGALTAGTASTTGLSGLVFSKGIAPPSSTGFTNSGTKGIPAGFCAMWPLS